MNILINPTYEYLREYLESVPVRFEEEGRTIYTGRNLIKVLLVDGLEINVKRYGIPSFLNRVIYSHFRASKGFRAFTYPENLLQHGFETPVPLAYIEQKSHGLIGYSYFISLQSPYKRNFYEFGNADIRECADVVTAFAHYTARLHQAGILHLDYSPGNILFDKVGDTYHFSLVDINRMRFGEVDIETGCANFARLWGQISFFEKLAEEYAIARGADKAYCRDKVLAYRRKFWKRFSWKHEVKYRLEL